MKPLSLDELRDIAPAYVMGTLSLEEQRAFDQAMRDPEIAASLEPEIEAHREAFEFLSSAHAVTPPPALKDRVMARVAATETRAGASPIEPQASSRQTLQPQQSAGLTLHASTPGASRTGRAGRAGWWAGAAGTLAFAATALFAVELRSRVRSLESELAAQVARGATADSALAERERTLASLLDAGNDLTLVRLTANRPDAGPGLQVFWNTREGRAVVSATGLAPIATDRAYCLWIIRNGTPEPVRLFQVDAAGRALVKDVVLPTDLAGIAAFALTEEPATGSPQPTMTPFLVGAVPPKS